MKYIALYIVAIAIAMTALATVESSFADSVTCHLGSYGKIQLQEEGKC